MMPERDQCLGIGGHGVVGEEAPDHLLQPLPLLGYWLVSCAGAAPP